MSVISRLVLVNNRRRGGGGNFSTFPVLCGKLQRIKDYFVFEKDWDKKPSAREIAEKNLPVNQPTLKQRIERDERHTFHQPSLKSGYYKGPTGTWRDYFDPDETLGSYLSGGAKGLKEETLKWFKELHSSDYDSFPRPGDERVLWNLQDHTEEDIAKKWVVTADSVWGEGYSWAQFLPSNTGQGAVFSGELNTTVPKDGRTVSSGYANIKAVTQLRSFYRTKYLNFEHFEAIKLRIRGDGRTYRLNIHRDQFFDVRWLDLWHYPIYTRGGPYWQDVVVPFGKFVLASKGSIQDKQEPFWREDVKNVSITLADQISGPFRLEIASISLLSNPHYHEEQSAYETYMFPRANYNQ